MKEESDKPKDSAAPGTNAPPNAFWALPWWGWTVVSFGGLAFLSGISFLIPTIRGESVSSENSSAFIGLLMSLVMLALLGCSFFAGLKRVLTLAGHVLPPSPRKPWIAIGSGLFAVGILLPLAAILIPSARTTPRSDAPAAVLQDVKHVFADGEYSLVVPETWEVMHDPSLMPSELFLSDRRNELYLVASATPRVDVTVTSVEEVLQNWVVTTSAMMTDPIPGETQITLREGESFADTTLEGAMNGANLVFRIRVIKSQTHWIEVRLWTSRSRYPGNSDLFEAIVSSVQSAE